MLRVADLAVSYGARPVLRGVELAVGRGEIAALIGRNAVGKTTLLKAIMGLVPALTGRLTLEGRDITNLPAHRRARLGLGYVPQGRHVFADLTVHENLLVGADLDPAGGRARIDRVLASFPRLAQRLRQPGGTLSGGEQQMLAIGRALAGNPKILLLDEPTAGIQPSLVDEIIEQLRSASRERGLPMILVEHNIEMVAALCSRICVMSHGRLAAEITPEQVHDEAIVRAWLAI